MPRNLKGRVMHAKPTPIQRLSRYRKAVLALVGAAATWALSTFPDDHRVQTYGGLALALLTALGVRQVSNDPPAGQPSDPSMSETGHADAAGLLYLAAGLVVLLVILRVFHLI